MWIIFSHTSLCLLLFSSAKENRRVSSSRKRGRTKRQKRENQASELKDEKNDDGSKEIPECPDVSTPEKTLPRSNEDATKMSFSDDDEDMNVDFDMDDDYVGNYENDGDSDADGPTAVTRIPDLEDEAKQEVNGGSKTKRASSSTCQRPAVAEPEETTETDTVKHVEKEDQKKRKKPNKQRDDVDSRGSSAVLNTGKIWWRQNVKK